MVDFFVSYNKADQAWAEWIAWTLEEAGYTTVIQAWDFGASGNFVLDMNKALSTSNAVVAVLSQNYLDAPYTQSEWTAAFARDPTGTEKKLIPVRIGPVEPKGLLATIKYIDIFGLPEERARTIVLAGLRRRAKPTARPRFPGIADGGASTPPPPKPAFPGPAPTSGGDGAPLIWAVAAGIAILLGVLIWQAPRIRRYDLGVVIVAIYVLLGLLAAYILFRVLDSSGALKGRAFGATFEYGGPAAVVVLFLLVGLNSRSDDSFVVQIHLIDHKKDPVSVDGRIEFTLETRHLADIKDGYGVATGIPSKYRGDPVTVRGNLEEHYAIINRTIELTPNQVIEIGVRKATPQPIAGGRGAITGTITATAPITTSPITATSLIAITTTTAADRVPLTTEYRERTDRLIALLNVATPTDEEEEEIEQIVRSLVDAHRTLGVQPQWETTVQKLKEKRPGTLEKFNIPEPR